MIRIEKEKLKRSRIAILTAAWVVCAALAGCGHGRSSGIPQEENSMYDSLWSVCWNARSLDNLPLIDSLQQEGRLSRHHADMLRGCCYDRARHIQVGENYYRKVYEEIDPEREGWDFYLKVADRLSLIRLATNNYKGVLDVATDVLQRAEKAGELDEENRKNFLWSISFCQCQLKMDEAEETALKTLGLMEEMAKQRGNLAVVEGVAFANGIMGQFAEDGEYGKAEAWMQRTEELLQKLDSATLDMCMREYGWMLVRNKIELLKGLGKQGQAQGYFKERLSILMQSPEGMAYAAGYLMGNEHYAEAAELYDRVDAILPADNKDSELNLDNIGDAVIPRLRAYLGAGRYTTAQVIARQLGENYLGALAAERSSNVAEQAIIFDTQGKEMQIAKQQAALSQQRFWGAVIAFVVVILFFILFYHYRRRAAARLAEVKEAQQRIESELRIARNIQMSMVPGVFPEYEGLDMYAEMEPAREVGGDLYGYYMSGDCLYFCVGDVSGKGVPASLFMAQSARLFRTFASEGMMPADIAGRMNNELGENNEEGMFVTMFIGRLQLRTGYLDFCNCGHNLPLLDGQFLDVGTDNPPLGLWEDDPFEGGSLEDIRGKQLLLYTDGLNEAENQSLELLGNQRLQQLMADATSLDAHQVVERLRTAVVQHRNGADPNDDLTIMCIRLAK